MNALRGIALLSLLALTASAQISTGLQARLNSRVGYADADSLWRGPQDEAFLLDLSGSLRPLLSAQSDHLRFAAELQLDSVRGDTYERAALFPTSRVGVANLLDLEHTLDASRRSRTTVELDRLSLTWTAPWGALTMGRHAVTWGGGFVFNPFDLFNPFAPSDVVRDYKAGSDMIHLDLPADSGGWQLLAVGRRDPSSQNPSFENASFAVLRQIWIDSQTLDLLAAWHYDEPVLGLGWGGLLGEASWHVDLTWQPVSPPAGGPTKDAFAAVANLQYSWLWAGHNVYGVLEFHYNGFGRSDYRTALVDPFLNAQRLRGNAFVLGQAYAAGSLQVELHPLVNFFGTVIVNLHDPSLLAQPRLVWNASNTMTLTAGLDLPIGRTGTEFGGFTPLPGGPTTRDPTAAYLLATWDF